MNKCLNHYYDNIDCPYAAFSINSPIPCFATNKQCREWRDKYHGKEIVVSQTNQTNHMKNIDNAINQLEIT